MLVCQECDCFPQYGSSCTQHDGLYEQPNLGAAISLNLQNTQSLRRCCNLQQSIQDFLLGIVSNRHMHACHLVTNLLIQISGDCLAECKCNALIARAQAFARPRWALVCNARARADDVAARRADHVVGGPPQRVFGARSSSHLTSLTSTPIRAKSLKRTEPALLLLCFCRLCEVLVLGWTLGLWSYLRRLSKRSTGLTCSTHWLYTSAWPRSSHVSGTRNPESPWGCWCVLCVPWLSVVLFERWRLTVLYASPPQTLSLMRLTTRRLVELARDSFTSVFNSEMDGKLWRLSKESLMSSTRRGSWRRSRR